MMETIKRFDNRIEYYSKCRPKYPAFLYEFLITELRLSKDMVLADIGSGDGNFSDYFIKNGYRIFCVEPNQEMRKYSEMKYSSFPNFVSIDSPAENIEMDSGTIDCVFVAQAFHWMDPQKTKNEFLRILKPKGRIVICWILSSLNSEFLNDYEQLRQKYAINQYPSNPNNEKILEEFFKPKKYNKRIFNLSLNLDFDSLKGLLLSVSFLPQKDNPGYSKMIDDLTKLFDCHNKNGFVQFDYDLPVYWDIK